MNNGDATTKLAREIGLYLTNHPRAADTLEGIVKWWLVKTRYEFWSKKVKRALDKLIAEGVVKAERNIDGEFIYSKASRRDHRNDDFNN